MGNFFSGRRRRDAGRCEAAKRIELSYLRKQGMLKPGWRWTLSWTFRGEPSGWIRIETETEGLRLIYRTRPAGGEWEDVDELIAYSHTATNFNGRRQWFVCPSCGRRCGVLYGFSRFRCRSCFCLTYSSQYEAQWERARDQAERIRKRLGGSGNIIVGDFNPFPPRPKGMWRATYEQLRQRDAELLDEANAGFCAEAGALLARLGGSP
jgi:hypothetical protein